MRNDFIHQSMQSSVYYQWPRIVTFQKDHIFSDYIWTLRSNGIESNEWVEKLRFANNQKGLGREKKVRVTGDILNDRKSKLEWTLAAKPNSHHFDQ